MATYKLTLISTLALAPRLDEIEAELRAQRLSIISAYSLNPQFDASLNDPMGDAHTIIAEGNLSPDAAKSLSHKLDTRFGLDAIIRGKESAETPIKLACFDMDSTLIQHETMDELAYQFGIGEKIAAITESAMRGELSFKESFEQRLACLKGFDASLMPGMAQNLKLTPGAQTLVKTLKANGTRVVILSGGFENFAQQLQQNLGPLDGIYSNILEIGDGVLTGKISNQLVDESRKLTLIKQLAAEQGITDRQTLAVGDGANDIPMLLHAGLGVAYRAKPLVQEKARHCINHNGLAAILYALGYERSQFVYSE